MMSKSPAAGVQSNPDTSRYVFSVIRQGRVLRRGAGESMTEVEKATRDVRDSIVEVRNQSGKLIGEKFKNRWYWHGKRGPQK